MNWKFILVLVWIFIGATTFAGNSDKNTGSEVDIPIPNEVDNLLFYIQRSVNKNTVVYELNIDEQNNIDVENPVSVYWINYEEGNAINPLTFIQENFSYGIDSRIIDYKDLTIEVNLKAYGNRKFYLKKSSVDNKYHAYTKMNSKWVLLENLFVNIEGGSFWFPNITYVTIEGKDELSGQFCQEILTR